MIPYETDQLHKEQQQEAYVQHEQERWEAGYDDALKNEWNGCKVKSESCSRYCKYLAGHIWGMEQQVIHYHAACASNLAILQTVKFIDWQFCSCTTEDGEHWWWAEFYFEDEQGKLVGESPVYIKGASDFHCLLEDTLKAAQQLSRGAYWQEVCNSFRQSW